MADSLFLATESSSVEIMRSLYLVTIHLAQCESIEKALPVAKRIREIRKQLEKFQPVRGNMSHHLLELKELSVKTQPTQSVNQLYHVLRQVLLEIEEQLSGLLAEMKRSTGIETMIPLARVVSEIRKNLPADVFEKNSTTTSPTIPVSIPSSKPSSPQTQPLSPPTSTSHPSTSHETHSPVPRPSSPPTNVLSTSPPPALSPSQQPSASTASLPITITTTTINSQTSTSTNALESKQSATETTRPPKRMPPGLAPIAIPITSPQHNIPKAEIDICDSGLYSDPIEDNRALSHSSAQDRLPELRVICSLALDEVYGKLDNLKQAFQIYLTMEDAVKNGRLLSLLRKDIDKMRVSIPLSKTAVATGGYLIPPENAAQHVKDLYKAGDQVLTEIYERLAGLRSVIATTKAVDDIVDLTKVMREMSQRLNSISKGSGQETASTQPQAPVSIPAPTPKLTNFSAGVTNPLTPKSKAQGFAANIPMSPKPNTSAIPPHLTEKYLTQFRSVSKQAVTEISSRLDFLQQHLIDIKGSKETIPLARLVGDIKKVLEAFPGEPSQNASRKSLSIQDNFVRVVSFAITDVSQRLKVLHSEMESVTMIEQAIPLARTLNDVRVQVETYVSSYCQDKYSRRSASNESPAESPQAKISTPDRSPHPQTPDQPKDESMKQNLESIRKAVASVSLERIIADMRKCYSEVGEGLGKAADDETPLDKRLAKLQLTIRKDQEDGRLAAEVEKAVSELQRDISALNIKRHVLTLAVRNLDRKINLLVRSQVKKSDDEDIDEVFQFFDESSQADHPLGNLKECYENFVYFLRQRPQYLTLLMPFIPYNELDNIAQMVTVSLFSDIFLSREELILLNLVKSIMSKSFEDCTDMSNFLRSNSLVTKLMAGYTKRQGGKLHLLEIFKTPLTELLIDEKTNLELDAPKVRSELESTMPKGTAPAIIDDETQKTLRQRTLQLQEFCANLLKNIISNLRNMPYGIRWLCKEMVRLAKEKFSTISARDESVLVGSFVFLRYLMPAVITPEGHGIITNISITARRRRNLILCGKVLQNLANDVEFGGKEQYMSVMNQFMVESRSIIFDYLKALTDVVEPEEYYHSVIDAGSTSSAIHQSVTITPNELLTVHRLVVDHHTEVVKESDDPMMLLLMKMGPPIENLPRKKNKYIVLEVLNFERELVSGPSSTFMKQLKERLYSVLQIAPTISPLAVPNPSVIQVLESIRKYIDPSAIVHVDYLIGKLSNIPDERRSTLEVDIISELEKELQSRRLYRQSLAKERQELSSALENQRNMVDQKASEKTIYTDYMLNIQKRAFQQKVKGNSEGKIGPFNFSMKELEKLKLLVPSPLLDSLRNSLVVEMVSSKPGIVHFTTHVRATFRGRNNCKFNLREI
eukprot:TRINITY_DN3484_c0_g1_i1.p1 TRINITY_DN3484_c0_g1~~TRINITY_DN3484_c0_g1_i1.p1  ORF type:complete len:1384 (-),score=321.96 TRINITY_DN3484_c0_g1_i1:166-4317(-)